MAEGGCGSGAGGGVRSNKVNMNVVCDAVAWENELQSVPRPVSHPGSAEAACSVTRDDG